MLQRKKKRGYALLIAIVCLLTGKLFANGTKLYVIGSQSMYPAYPQNSIVMIEKKDYNTLKEGDVIAFKSDALNGRVALHRIVKRTEQGIITKGDANNHADNQIIDQAAYVGKCVYKITFMARYLHALRTPIGFGLFFVLPTTSLAALALLLRRARLKKVIL